MTKRKNEAIPGDDEVLDEVLDAESKESRLLAERAEFLGRRVEELEREKKDLEVDLTKKVGK